VADNNLVTSDASSPTIASANNSQKTLTDSNGNLVIDPNTNEPYPMPDGMDIAANVRYAQAFAQTDATEAEKDMLMVYWFRQGGPQDYQRPEGYIAARLGDMEMSYRAITNYNYGAVAAAMGYSLVDSLYYAGLHNQLIGNPNQPEATSYGIQQKSVNNITQGYNDYRAGRWANLSDLE